jgi:hypothetical protein
MSKILKEALMDITFFVVIMGLVFAMGALR